MISTVYSYDMVTRTTARAAATEPAAKDTGIAFLLAQLGAHASEMFRQRAQALELTRPQAGLLRLIDRQPGQSQQAIAAQLGTPPSRLVALVDGLQDRGLVERRRNPEDRRNYALHLTPAGQATMRQLERAYADHEADVIAPLTSTERRQLSSLLSKLASAHQLSPGIHPGYRTLGRS